MSYAIIRNAKYKRENLMAVYRHNERKNKNYSNKDIDRTKTNLNYSLKNPEFNYVKEFDEIIKKYNLKGQIKTVSNIVCEYMITSDNDFFKRIGEEETFLNCCSNISQNIHNCSLLNSCHFGCNLFY